MGGCVMGVYRVACPSMASLSLATARVTVHPPVPCAPVLSCPSLTSPNLPLTLVRSSRVVPVRIGRDASPRCYRAGAGPLSHARGVVCACAGLSAGDAFPDLGELETDKSTAEEKVTLNLKDVLQSEAVVLFVYPKANTSGCTKQACGFNAEQPTLGVQGYRVLGLSADAPSEQADWKAKYGITYDLVCDPSHKALKLLGVSDGTTITRSHFVINKGGVVKDAKIGVKSGESVPEVQRALGIPT